MISDAELMALCAEQEAANQPDDGVAAIVHTVLARVRLGYQCDHSIAGAITRHAQFSWTEYDICPGGYHQVAFDLPEEEVRIAKLLELAKAQTATWARCSRIAGDVMAGRYAGGAAYQRLTGDTVLYYNPAACKTPAWATLRAFVCRIGAHEFYRDLNFKAVVLRPSTAPAPGPIASPPPSSSAPLPAVALANL